MASSRIFIKNLPPQLKEEDFKKHFSSLAPITDARLIAKRRIGYVGYGTPETAQKAVKYYNRSFIRMSKVHVELARPAEDVQSRKKARYEADLPFEIFGGEKKTNVDPEDPRLKEFLNVMAPTSKSKTWANEDLSGTGKAEAVVEAPVDQDDAASEDDYQTISKKRKRGDEDVKAKDTVTIAQEQPITATTAEVVTSTMNRDRDVEDKSTANDEADPTQSAVPTSDSDWLRSRTSRLLDLVDDDEIEDANAPAQAKDSEDVDEPSRTSRREEPTPLARVEEEPSSAVDVDNQSEEDEDYIQIPTPPPENSDTGRLFLRNLFYGTNDADLQDEFSKYGTIEEVHIARDTRTGVSKGFGFVQFLKPDDALAAKEALDGKSFQGRLLHIILAKAKKNNGLDEYEISKLPLKKQREIRRKAEASTATFKWNSLYMNPDAVLSSVAGKLGVSKADFLDPTSSDAAVKQAHAETDIIKETKDYFTKHGVNLESFRAKNYSDRAILVKNFPHGTSAEELREMFSAYGTVTRLLMPPAATIAIIEMEQSTQSKAAFSSLAYKKFKDTMLFLEKAPKALFTSERVSDNAAEKRPALESDVQANATVRSTLFVRNLNFSTTSLELRDLFMPLNGFLSATVRTKPDPKHPGQTLSMGFGFVEFSSKPDASSAMAAMNGYTFAGHELIVKESNKAIDAGEERRQEDAAKKLAGQRTKIVIRNLPFEATKKDVRALCGPYGQLRTVRVPRKFDGTSRGFAFAEFVTSREAENAIKSLTDVHLSGRRLNLEYAAGDLLDAEEEIEKMSKKASKQADKMALQNLTGGGRKKFSVHQGEDTDMN